MSGTDARKLIVTTMDLPYPPHYGHKVDQFHRWRGFAERGWRLRLICWQSPNMPSISQHDVAALSRVFETIEVLTIAHDAVSFIKRLIRLPHYPSHVSSRIPDAATMRRIEEEARVFAPDAIVNDGIYGGVIGNRLARACGVPMILRGHNVEHRYFRQQARAAMQCKSKFVWMLAQVGLERWERFMTENAAWSFQISADDVAFWKREGVEHVSWAPTVIPDVGHGTLVEPDTRRFDVAYIGNMRLPNNLGGLRWFVEAVLPELRRLRPGITLCFAGADPSVEARALFATAPDIVLVPDAPSVDGILSQGRVLINPILSGSGINVKSIDMLRYDAPIITTRIGVQGFAPELCDQFVVRDDPHGFAVAIVDALADPVPPPGRAAARATFGSAGLDNQIAAYDWVIAARAAGK